ncbi:hypothetical protein [Pseudorhodoferax sp.]|uniref:hypothetical protein n=1 Tax=Pseudorhodoferax sp. TaxID=1993553 RepID=UPI002DD62F37|nr:hypothetical protein [Pseudorhodoferax sp.]
MFRTLPRSKIHRTTVTDGELHDEAAFGLVAEEQVASHLPVQAGSTAESTAVSTAISTKLAAA